MCSKKVVISFLLFISIIVKINSQNINKKEYSLSATIFNEKFTETLTKPKNSPQNLGATIALEMQKPRKGIYQFSHILQVGYYYHKDFNQVAFLAWKPKFEIQVFNLINVHTILGLGYAHSFPVRESYTFKNNTYAEDKNYGNSHFMPSIGLGIGLNLETMLNVPLEVFSRYEAFSLAPYALKGRVPFTINGMFQVGVKIKI